MTRLGDALAVALAEYKQLWGYYHRTLDERKNLFEWYFKAVTLPAAIVGYAVSGQPGAAYLDLDVGAAILFVIFIVGITLLVTYAKESSNATKYERGMKAMRKYFRNAWPEVSGAITIDEERAFKSPIAGMGSIKVWRGATIAIINSAIATAAITINVPFAAWSRPILSFIGLVAAHMLLYRLMYERYNAEE